MRLNPLFKAVFENRTDVATFLIESGVSPDPESGLFNAAVSKDNLEMVKLLLPFFDINKAPAAENAAAISLSQYQQDCPIFYVRSVEMAKFLVKNGANLKVLNSTGALPHEAVEEPKTAAYLKKCYNVLNAQKIMIPSATTSQEATSWDKRFVSSKVDIHDLEPVDYDRATGKFAIKFNDQTYSVSDRFLNSFARKLKFSNNIFNYFSAEEVFNRVYERNPDLRFKVTFDEEKNEVLGVVDESKKILPPELACQVFSEDPRVQHVTYDNGLWKAELHLDTEFAIPNDSSYQRRLIVHYPVDGVTMPAIYLAVVRQVCSNGATAQVAKFRTEIEINDNSGTHFSRLLRSYNNDNGFAALESRLLAAQETKASVNELLKVEQLLSNHITDTASLARLKNRIEEMAGDPCTSYVITSLNNIHPKRRPLLPVNCSVNDLVNFCSELTTHHANLLHSVEPFNGLIGSMLSEEFDLEGMYNHRSKASAFHLDNIGLSTLQTRNHAERAHNVVW